MQGAPLPAVAPLASAATSAEVPSSCRLGAWMARRSYCRSEAGALGRCGAAHRKGILRGLHCGGGQAAVARLWSLESPTPRGRASLEPWVAGSAAAKDGDFDHAAAAVQALDESVHLTQVKHGLAIDADA